MAFDNLPPQPPIFPAEAATYAETALSLSREAAARTRCVLDIPYGDDYWQKVDVYLPDDAGAERLPVLVFAHGGAWTHGYKEWMGLLAPAIVATPAVFVSVSYRLAPEHRYPVPMEDCLAALAWVHRNIADHGGDPDRLFVGGHSAGGHLYALAALRRDLQVAAGIDPGAIRACLPVSSQLNLQFGETEPGSGEERIYTMFLERAEQDTEASPIARIAGSRLPFLLSFGSEDFPRIIRSNREMVEALRREGCPVAVQEFPGADHFDMAIDVRDPDHAWTRAVCTWLRDGPDVTRVGAAGAMAAG